MKGRRPRWAPAVWAVPLVGLLSALLLVLSQRSFKSVTQYHLPVLTDVVDARGHVWASHARLLEYRAGEAGTEPEDVRAPLDRALESVDGCLSERLQGRRSDDQSANALLRTRLAAFRDAVVAYRNIVEARLEGPERSAETGPIDRETGPALRDMDARAEAVERCAREGISAAVLRQHGMGDFTVVAWAAIVVAVSAVLLLLSRRARRADAALQASVAEHRQLFERSLAGIFESTIEGGTARLQ